MKEFYNCKEVAERYGVKTLTVWAWIREGKLHAVSLNGRYRVRECDMREFEGKKNRENEE